MIAAMLMLPGGFQSHAADWPGYRGPTGMGVTEEKDLPLSWNKPAGTNVLWKSPLPPTVLKGDADHNQSSPIVVGEKVIVTTSHWLAGVDHASAQPEHHISCYDANSGKQLWDTVVKAGPWVLKDLRGGYTSPTPVVADGRVFAVFGSSIIHALDLDGKPLWSQVIADHDKFDVALATSPVVYKDTVIMLLDRKSPASAITAWDVAGGALRWEKKRPETEFGHVTPVLAEIAGKPEMLICATKELQGADPASGDVIWSCKWGTGIWPVSSPVMAQGLVYAIGGRGGHPGLIVDPTGTGNVTTTHLKAKIGPMSEGLSSPVAFGDYVYRLNTPGVLRCVRITSGEEVYKERLLGADPAVSPIVTPEGRLYFASAGKTVVVQSGPEFKVIAESDLGDGSQAAAAAAHGRLYLKGKKNLYAIGTK